MEAKLAAWFLVRTAFLLVSAAGIAQGQGIFVPGGGRPGLPGNMSQAQGITFTGGDRPNLPLDPPLKQTAEGQPIDSRQSPNATLSYVNDEVQSRAKIKHFQTVEAGNPSVVDDVVQVYLPAGLDTAMIPVVAKFGVANLLEARRMQPSPRTEQGNRADFLLKDYETKIILKALTLAVTDNDLAVVTEAANKDPEVMALLLAHPSWRGSTGVDNLVSTKLDSISEKDFDSSSAELLQYGLGSSDPTLQAKANDIVKHWMDKVSNMSKQEQAYQRLVTGLRDLMIAGIENPSANGAAFFSTWAPFEKDNLAESTPSQQAPLNTGTNPTPSGLPGTRVPGTSVERPGTSRIPDGANLESDDVISRIAATFADNPSAFEQKGFRDGVQILVGSAATDENEQRLFLEAGSGNLDAFRKLMTTYAQVTSSPANVPGPSGSGTTELAPLGGQRPNLGAVSGVGAGPGPQSGPGGQPGMGSQPMRNGSSIPGAQAAQGTSPEFGWQITEAAKTYGKSLMKQVTFVGPGDKIQGVAANLEQSVFNNGKWTVTASATYQPLVAGSPPAPAVSKQAAPGLPPPTVALPPLDPVPIPIPGQPGVRRLGVPPGMLVPPSMVPLPQSPPPSPGNAALPPGPPATNAAAAGQ